MRAKDPCSLLVLCVPKPYVVVLIAPRWESGARLDEVGSLRQEVLGSPSSLGDLVKAARERSGLKNLGSRAVVLS